MSTETSCCSMRRRLSSSGRKPALAAARLLMCALLSCAATAATWVTANAAIIVTVSNPSEGELVNRSSHYEMILPSSTGMVSFDVSIAGAQYDSGLIFRTLVGDAANHPVTLASPSRVSVLDAGANTVTLSLAPNPAGVAQEGDVILSLIYEDTGTVLGNVRVRVTRGVSGAQSPGVEMEIPAQSEGAEDAAVLGVLQSETAMPEIEIDGDRATLTYKNPAAVSWGGAPPDITLTIGDVTQLQKDTPVRIPGWNSGTAVYDIVLPPQQINAILSAKASDIADSVVSDIIYREDPDNTDMDLQLITIVPANGAVLPEFTAIEPMDEAFSAPADNSLELTASAAGLASRMPGDILLDIRVFYMGVEAGDFAVVRIPISDEESFPVLNLSLQQGVILPDGEDASPSVPGEYAGGVDIGGLVQYYDPELNGFVQTMGPNASFRTNIPNGAFTNQPVVLEFPSGINYEVLLENEPVDYLTGQAISKNGRYTVIARARIEDEQAIQDAQSELGDISGVLELLKIEKTCRFTFRVINRPVSGLLCYSAPPGFAIAGFWVDGEKAEPPGDYYAFVEDPGSYEVEIQSEDYPSLYFSSKFTVDNTPPTVKLIGVSNGGATYGSVELEYENDVESLTVLKDSQPYALYANTINQAGTYRIVAEDSAGNRSHYEFRVLYSLNMSGWTSFMLMLLLIGGIGGYLFYARTHMKVR